MGFLRRFAPQTITAQIAGLVVVAVLLGVSLASAVLLYFFYTGQPGVSPEIMAAVRAARIAAIVKEAEAAPSPIELAQALKAARSHSQDVELIPIARLVPVPESAPRHPAIARLVKAALADTWGIVPLASAPPSDDKDSIVIKISDDNALVFEAPSHTPFYNLVLVQTTCALAIVIFIISFLSLYAVRWVTSPLSSIAAAARSFGHSSAEDGTLSADGPREIAQVAEALNDMRKRVRSLVDERTQMLAAISHDLRTPLTRLRLRTERLTDVNLRDSMLQDIATVNDMLGETLAYLREGGQLEPVHLVDLPSLLQTICAQFTDFGYDVSYQGPDRFAFACRAHALNRAVTNVVDNGTKHGAIVTVALRVLNETSVQIEVSDDGPGIPLALRDKVFEPFFKGDSARPSSGRVGFGLGLSIARDIVRRHGGKIDLLNDAPQGQIVRLSVAGQPGAKIWNFAVAADA
ncbi:ATP-binding protein [Methylocapsa sp. S129]|uniref:ATP-binding protein n=1 Tax=Methylocapsa sp. S129 TaxID=1641869 RepID=UPI00131ACDC8|nr:ATP-binding protein [Methylocapsa sp. S129]